MSWPSLKNCHGIASNYAEKNYSVNAMNQNLVLLIPGSMFDLSRRVDHATFISQKGDPNEEAERVV
jgi:hypothetical protein